jgi:hypothetical protein
MFPVEVRIAPGVVWVSVASSEEVEATSGEFGPLKGMVKVSQPEYSLLA